MSYGIAQEVLGCWTETNSPRVFGPWSIGKTPDGWSVQSPAEMTEILAKFELPDGYASPEEAVKAVEFQAVAGSIRLPGAPLGFHGALLRKDGVGLALVGIKEAGKSTLAAALSQAGWELFSDDTFQIDEESLAGYSMCRRARLRAGSRALLSETVWERLSGQRGSFLQPDGGLAYHSEAQSAEGIRLTHMVVLKPEPRQLQELEASDLLLQTVVHCHTYYAEGLPQSLAKLGPLSNSLKGYEMGRRPLTEQVKALGSLV